MPDRARTNARSRATSFGAVSVDYDRYRLEPAAGAVDWVLRPGAKDVLDVGAGTGQLTRVLVQWGAKVTAVEPDGRMRLVLAERAPAATVLAGSAELLPVEDASQDAVLAHAAWHWFDQRRAVSEAARVLRPGGRLGILQTGFDRDVDWLAALWERLEPDSAARRPGGRSRWARTPSRLAARLRGKRMFADRARAPFTPQEGPHVVRFSRQITREQLIGLAGTYSGVLVRPELERAGVLEQVRQAIDAHPRLAAPTGLEVSLLTRCWRADRR